MDESVYEEFLDLFSSLNVFRLIKLRIMRWAGHMARMERGRGACGVLVGKLEGTRITGGPKRRWIKY